MAKKRQTIILNQIDVLRAGAKGVSIGKLADGKTVLIKDAIPGDVVDVQVTKKRKSYIEGKAIAYHKKSADRVEPACEHFGTCGGCKWQDMHYDAQLRYKQEEVLNNLIRIGGFANLSAELLPILGSEQAYWYRNKLEFTFSNARWLTLEEINSTDEFNDRNALGFHIPGQWSKVLDIHRCHLQRDPSNAIRIEAKRFAIENKLDFFDLYKQEGFLRTLMIRTSQNGQAVSYTHLTLPTTPYV